MNGARRLLSAEGIFAQLHAHLVGAPVDFDRFDAAGLDPERLVLARAVWGHRVESEFRSIQVLARFVTEVLGAGDPLEVYAGAVDAVMDEVRHTALCAGMLRALGGEPRLPDPVEDVQHPEFLALPMAQRALSTAISMLAISETLSVGFIRDLAARCDQPVVRGVLLATLADEDRHHDYGWAYVAESLSRFEGDGMPYWHMVVRAALAPHLERSRAALAAVPLHRRHLDAWPEPELAELGLLSSAREALVFEQTYQRTVAPRLAGLGLLPA